MKRVYKRRYITLTSSQGHGRKTTSESVDLMTLVPYEAPGNFRFDVYNRLPHDLYVFSERGEKIMTFPGMAIQGGANERTVTISSTTRTIRKETKTHRYFTDTTLSFTISLKHMTMAPIHLPELGLIIAVPSTVNRILSFEEELLSAIDTLELDFNKQFRFHVNPQSFMGKEVPSIYVFDGLKMNMYPVVCSEEIPVGKVKIYGSTDDMNITGEHSFDFLEEVDVEKLETQPHCVQVETNLGVNKYFISFDYQLITILARTERKTPQFTKDELFSQIMTSLEEKAKRNLNLTLEENRLHVATFQQECRITELTQLLDQQKISSDNLFAQNKVLLEENNSLKQTNNKLETENEELEKRTHKLEERLEDAEYDLKRERRERKEENRTKSRDQIFSTLKVWGEILLIGVGTFFMKRKA